MPSRDLYTWRVTYKDGTHTDEYDAERTDGRGFAEIENKPVKAVSLLTDGKPIHSVLVTGDPVFFRRRRIFVDPIIGSQYEDGMIHCIGWFFDASYDRAGGTYLFVFEDGSTLLSDDLQAV
jgi:hypothetical protein